MSWLARTLDAQIDHQHLVLDRARLARLFQLARRVHLLNEEEQGELALLARLVDRDLIAADVRAACAPGPADPDPPAVAAALAVPRWKMGLAALLAGALPTLSGCTDNAAAVGVAMMAALGLFLAGAVVWLLRGADARKTASYESSAWLLAPYLGACTETQIYGWGGGAFIIVATVGIGGYTLAVEWGRPRAPAPPAAPETPAETTPAPAVQEPTERT